MILRMASSKRKRDTAIVATAKAQDADKIENEELAIKVNGINANSEEDNSDSDNSGSDSSSVYSGLSDDDEDNSEDDSESEDKDSQNSALEDEENQSLTTKLSSDSALQQSGSARQELDEYEYDSSDEEDLRNTIGNVPIEWYDEYDHIGYDLDGKKILKPAGKHNEVDEFLDKMDNPDYWRTVYDKMTGQKVRLSDTDVDLIKNISKGKCPDGAYDPYAPWIEFFTNEVMIHPVINTPVSKKSFIPSLVEKAKVSKLVHAIKMGWIKPKQPVEKGPKYYMLWDKDDSTGEGSKRMQHYLHAPKLTLPGHNESYNPAPEYLPTKEQVAKWESKHEGQRPSFIPTQHPSLLSVPAYPHFIKERFERCLDLYLCPRQRKFRVNINPDDLIPKLPKPKDLQPFPTTLTMVYHGHKSFVRSIAVEPQGQFIASGSDDKTVRVWEIATGRCVATFNLPVVVKSIAWCPNINVCLIAIAVGNKVIIINPNVGDKLISTNTDMALKAYADTAKESKSDETGIEWSTAEDNEWSAGQRLIITHSKEVAQVTWHAKGDYLATIVPSGGNKSVFIHQLSKRRSQMPFSKSKGIVQRVLFHPNKPYFFVATQRYVRIYNLMKQELTKKLMTNCKWISSLALHSGGDNLLIGSYDSRLSWFDLDLSSKPYQMLRYHKKAVRQVAFHKRYPLFASASDDGSLIISHGMVYNDLLQNPLIVPVKIMKGHRATDDLGVLDCAFHPTQPWVFSSGADSKIHLYT